MKNEINKDFYCSGNHYNKDMEGCKAKPNGEYGNYLCVHTKCWFNSYHRKWPTPEQYKEEYGEESPHDAAIYFLDEDVHCWHIEQYDNFLERDNYFIVCACTPYGKPDKDWRPCDG